MRKKIIITTYLKLLQFYMSIALMSMTQNECENNKDKESMK